MSKDVLKSDTPDVWTREQARSMMFSMLESSLMDYELAAIRAAGSDKHVALRISCYVNCLQIARQILRLQMEVMGGPQKGIEHPLFIEVRNKIQDLQVGWAQVQRRSVDPVIRSNQAEDFADLVEETTGLIDQLFDLNTRLGINYKKRDNPNMAVLK